jgi:uncharacterized protein (DUF1778 family)
MDLKSAQLQIRVSPAQKATLKRLAREAGMDVSQYVLARALPDSRRRFGEAVQVLARSTDHRYALAELNELLAGLTPAQLHDAVGGVGPALHGLPPFLQNYLTAMVEQACGQRDVVPPSWTTTVQPLGEPHFATSLRGLRLHLLRAAPVAFKRRNIFVDASVGARV